MALDTRLRNRLLLLTSVCGLAACQTMPEPSFPVADGPYTFVVKFVEHPNRTGGSLDVQVSGRHIRLTSPPGSSVFPVGTVDEGTLLWHAASGQWIISKSKEDAEAPSVGGCSGGPAVVDLQERIYWTC